MLQESRRWDLVHDILRDICLFPGEPITMGLKNRSLSLKCLRLKSVAIKSTTNYAGRFSVWLES